MHTNYKQWLASLKQQIRCAQIKAALQVNAGLIELYWQLGEEIIQKEQVADWGDGLIPKLSKDLLTEFPDMKGFSKRNLFYVRQWVHFYYDAVIVQQPVAQLQHSTMQQLAAQTTEPISSPLKQPAIHTVPELFTLIPWGHHLQIVTKCKTVEEAYFYIKETAEYNWSRTVLVHQIESKLYQRKGTAITNFSTTLPQPQSDLAQQMLKDPYKFDFLSLSAEYKEKDLENALEKHITKFLLELGAGFSYVGRQYALELPGDTEDRRIDLLFYHLKLRCFVVVELKTKAFEPEFAGKLNFYLNIVDDRLRHPADSPSIGLLICKERNKVIAEYALRGIEKPIGITTYELNAAIPENLKGSLPSIEEIEAELNDEANFEQP